MFNTTSFDLSNCTNSVQTYMAIIMAVLLTASEAMGSTDKSKYNGLLHVFSSQCFKKKE